jgi:hypothetical protein
MALAALIDRDCLMSLTERSLPKPVDTTSSRGALRCRVAVVFVAVASGIGCTGSGPVVGLRSDEVAGRIPAMKLAAEKRDLAAVPSLIDSLASDDSAERLYAIQALQRITGQTLDYHYYDTDANRAAAIERWKAWLAAQPRAAPKR